MDRDWSRRRHPSSSDIWSIEPGETNTDATRTSGQRGTQQRSTVLLDLPQELRSLKDKVKMLTNSTARCRNATGQLADLEQPVKSLQHNISKLRAGANSRFACIEDSLTVLQDESSVLMKRSERVRKLMAAEEEAEGRVWERARAQPLMDDVLQRASITPRDAHITVSRKNTVREAFGRLDSESQNTSRAACATEARLRETGSWRGTPNANRGELSENFDPTRLSRESRSNHDSTRRRSTSPSTSVHHKRLVLVQSLLLSDDPLRVAQARRLEQKPRMLVSQVNGTSASPTKEVVPTVYGSSPSSDTGFFPPLQQPLPQKWEKLLSKASFFHTLADILRELSKRRREINAEVLLAELKKHMDTSAYYELIEACWGTQRFLSVAAKFIKISNTPQGIVLADTSHPFRTERDNQVYLSRAWLAFCSESAQRDQFLWFCQDIMNLHQGEI